MEKDQNFKKENQNIDKTEDNSEIKESTTESKPGIDSENDTQIKEEVKEVSAEDKIKELEDKVTRTFAEMENQRRRFEKEREDAFNYGGFSFAKETLNLIDNLERSKQILENDEALKNTEALKKTLEHFDIINKDLISIFSKNNIKPINSIGEKLNPNHHQAMMEIEDDDKEPGVIIQEIQKGYMMKDRLLRPSLVGVANKSSKKDEKPSKHQPELKD